MTEYTIQLVSKSDGNERFKRISAKSKESARKKMSDRGYDYHNHMSVMTKSAFLKHIWNRGSGDFMSHAEYEIVWHNAPNNPISKESWKEKMGKYWNQLPTKFKKLFEEVTWGHIEKVKS